MKALNKILVPLTLLEDSHAVLPVARKLAQDTGATMVLLHVVEPVMAGEYRGGVGGDWPGQLREGANILLNLIAAKIRSQVPVEVVVCEGQPAAAIMRQVEKHEAEVIVMCSHGDRGWSKWLHRNTALQVMKEAPCAVCLVCPGQTGETLTVTVAQPSDRPVESVLPRMAQRFSSLLQVLLPDFSAAKFTGTSRRFFTVSFPVGSLE